MARNVEDKMMGNNGGKNWREKISGKFRGKEIVRFLQEIKKKKHFKNSEKMSVF
jgi:hypothetical protein